MAILRKTKVDTVTTTA